MKKITFLAVIMMLLAVFTAKSQTAVQPVGAGTNGNPYQIASLNNLYWLSINSAEWDKYFIQTADINADNTHTWNISGTDTLGFLPIGNSTTKFTGNYNGQEYVVNNLFINRPDDDYIGLFGYIYNATIDSLGVVNCDITGHTLVGCVAGGGSNIILNNLYSSGIVNGYSNVGGITGKITSSSVLNYCYNEAEITASFNCGGLTAYNYASSITNSYNFGNISCSSTGIIGGLVGNVIQGSISNSYSIGQVSDVNNHGGLVGDYTDLTIENSFWNIDIVPLDNGAGGTGLTTSQMKQMCVYVDSTWDFMIETVNGSNNIWGLNASENGGYPFLAWQGYTHTAECCGYIDLTDPVLSAQNFTLQLDATGSATLKASDVVTSATDNCSIADTTLSQTAFDCSNLGTNNVDVTLNDISGNDDTKTVTITVEDNIAPTITCMANQVVTADNTHNYTVQGTEFDPTATNDNCDVDSVYNSFNSDTTLAGANIPEGNTIITWYVEDASGNIDSCSFNIVVNTYGTSVNAIANNKIIVYPNPTNGIFTISGDVKIFDNDLSVSITDIAGKTLLQSDNLTNDISNLPNGVYFVKIQTGNEVIIKKIIKD